jgi:PGF-CTERM protein
VVLCNPTLVVLTPELIAIPIPDETTETTITVIAETPGFSVFAVTETADDSSAEGSGSNGADTDGNGDGNESDTAPTNTSENDDDEVITPSEPDEQSDSGSDPTPEDQPGFGIISVVAALVIAAGGSLRSRTERRAR